MIPSEALQTTNDERVVEAERTAAKADQAALELGVAKSYRHAEARSDAAARQAGAMKGVREPVSTLKAVRGFVSDRSAEPAEAEAEPHDDTAAQ